MAENTNRRPGAAIAHWFPASRRAVSALTLLVASVAVVGCVSPRYSTPRSVEQPTLFNLPVHDSGVAVHRVSSGDTLYSIARSYSVPVGELVRLNSRVDARQLAIGTRLVVPAAKPRIRSIERRSW